jgi:ribosomal protein S18 acetylase RimI-like enzyme
LVLVLSSLGGASIPGTRDIPMLRHVTDSDLEGVRAFLEAHADTSLFLLSTLAALGPRLGQHANSGNFWLAEEAGRIVVVFCVTRRGNLLVQAGGRVDLASEILAASATEPVEVRGVVGEWPTAHSLWRLLSADPGFEPTHNLKDVVYRLPLKEQSGVQAGSVPPSPGFARNGQPITIRALAARDFSQWERLNSAYFAELNLPVTATLEERKGDFTVRIRSGLWWGAFADSRELISIAALNTTYGSLAEVGGVYTRPQDRNQGLAGAVMAFLIQDSRKRLGFERLVLFTAEDNAPARRLYESLGFSSTGYFGLLLGDRRAKPAPQRYKWAGQSGETYTYEVFDWPVRLTAAPGNYIFAASTGAGRWRALLVGERADLSTLSVHDQMSGGAAGSAITHIHVRLNFNPASVRRREVNDLAARWTAPDGNSKR